LAGTRALDGSRRVEDPGSSTQTLRSGATRSSNRIRQRLKHSEEFLP
jgi:hypothetical protein